MIMLVGRNRENKRLDGAETTGMQQLTRSHHVESLSGNRLRLTRTNTLYGGVLAKSDMFESVV